MKKIEETIYLSILISRKYIDEEIRKAYMEFIRNKKSIRVLRLIGPNLYPQTHLKGSEMLKHEKPILKVAQNFSETLEYLDIKNLILDDWTGIETFSKLKGLSITMETVLDKGHIKDFPPLDFNNYPSLEKLCVWSVENLKNLEYANIKELIYIAKGRNKKDLSVTIFPLSLTWMEIREDAITSLNGLETATNLGYLELFCLRSLQDISTLGLLNNLHTLNIKNCPKIDFKNMPNINSLKRIFIDTNIADISFLSNLPNLEEIYIYKNVMDGDLSPIVDLSKLKKLYFKDKKHFSHKYKELCTLKNIELL